MNVRWPSDVLPPRKVMVDPVYATISAGRSITGVEQIVAGDAGYWAITLDEIPCAKRVQKQVGRALSVQMNGRLGLMDVPIYDQASAPGVGGFLGPFGDGGTFGDGGLFETAGITASIVGAVALGAVSMSINLAVGSTLQPGQHFSVMGATKQRLFRLKTTSLLTGTTYAVTVWPPTREAIPDGSDANFSDPRCTCRAKTDAEFQSFVDDYAGRTLAKVDFEEALP